MENGVACANVPSGSISLTGFAWVIGSGKGSSVKSYDSAHAA
jgi:hypothetical protein